MIKNRYISTIYKAILFLLGLSGVFIQCGFFGGELNLSVLRYYTLLSNLLCVIYFGAAAVYSARGKETVFPRFKATLIMGITVTGLVYHFMLSDTIFDMGGTMAVSNIILHYAVPVMAVLDWILFDEKGRYTKLSPLLWVTLPDIYFVLAVIYGFTLGSSFPFYSGSRFPYFFIDFDVLGFGGVMLYVLILNLLFVALGYVFYLLDRILAKIKI